MDLRLTPDELAFRAEVRAFVRDNLPAVDPRKERRPAPSLQGRLRALDTHPRRQGLGRAALAQGMGRHGLESGQAVDLSRRDPARQRARGDRLRRQHGRPGHLHLRLAGAEGTVPAAHRRSPRLVVPGLFRARRGIRPREPAHQRPARWRRVGDLRPEDLDDDGPIRRLDLRPRPHQPAGRRNRRASPSSSST